jgi:glycosyltransferase involved in cell wall biosynthesis
VALGYLRGAGYTLALRLRDRRPRLPTDQPVPQWLEAMMARADPLSPALEIHHLPAHAIEPDYGTPLRVARTMVEVDRLRKNWPAYCEPLTEIWVPSTFSAQVFLRAGIGLDRLRVVPIGVDTQVFRPAGSPAPARAPWSTGEPGGDGVSGGPLPWPEATTFKFLSVLTWQWRKGWDILLSAYLDEFEPGEEVALVLKAISPTIRRGCRPVPALDMLRDFIRHRLGRDPSRIPRILVIQRPVSEAHLAALYTACDAFVLPSRGEGWGRPYLEAMATGLPTIGTRWSGNLDFMTDANSYLLDVEHLDVVGPGATQNISPKARWASPSRSHLRRLMRRLSARPAEALARAATARRQAVAQWDIAVTGRNLAREIDRLLGLRR